MQVSKEERRDVLELFNISETARMVGMQTNAFHMDLRKGFLPPPTVEVGKRKYYRLGDVNRIAAYLKKKSN